MPIPAAGGDRLPSDLLYLPSAAEPFTTYLWWDLLRVGIAAASLWLGALVLRLAWSRWAAVRHGYQIDSTHPATYLSYGLGLLAVGGLRAAGLGTPPDLRMAISLIILIPGMWGILRRVEIAYPPYVFAKTIVRASARAGRDAGRLHLRDRREEREERKQQRRVGADPDHEG